MPMNANVPSKKFIAIIPATNHCISSNEERRIYLQGSSLRSLSPNSLTPPSNLHN
jgi:hypothetical protein